MTFHSLHKWHGLIRGSFFIFLGEVLGFPIGLITVAFLTRSLGPDGFGLLTLVTMIITWVEFTIISIFARATIKLIGEAEDWRSIGSLVVKVHVWTSLAASVLLWVLASSIASLLDAPETAGYLRLFCLDIPLVCLGRAYRNILIGIGKYREGALCNSIYLLGKLILTLVFVGIGISVNGAILATIGASLIEVAVSQFFYIRFSLFGSSKFSFWKLFNHSLPLFLSSLSMSFYNRLGLFALKTLGGTMADAGVYGAAQRISQGMSIFAISFSPVLVSNLTRSISSGDLHFAKKMARQAMRFILALLPFVAILAGSSSDIVRFVFGANFLAAAPLLSILILGFLAQLLMSVTGGILTSVGKQGWILALNVPMVLLAFIGHLILVPRFGAAGAAFVTTAFSVFGAFASILAVHRIWHVLPPAITLLRSGMLATLAYTFSLLWHTPDLFLFVKISVLGSVLFFAFWIFGEFGSSEITLLCSLFRRQPLNPAPTDI